jgi:hypothetical protein
MRIASPTFRIATGLLLAVLLSVVGYQVFRHSSFYAPEALLKQADEMSWLNSWIEAEPLYRQPAGSLARLHLAHNLMVLEPASHRKCERPSYR